MDYTSDSDVSEDTSSASGSSQCETKKSDDSVVSWTRTWTPLGGQHGYFQYPTSFVPGSAKRCLLDPWPEFSKERNS